MKDFWKVTSNTINGEKSPKQRIDGTAALLDCYVGLYEHYNEYTSAI